MLQKKLVTTLSFIAVLLMLIGCVAPVTQAPAQPAPAATQAPAAAAEAPKPTEAPPAAASAPTVGFVPPALTSPFHVALVDGATARLLHIEKRRSDLIENIHDGSTIDRWPGIKSGTIKICYTSLA